MSPLPDGQLVRVRRTHARNSVIERTVDSEEFVLSFDSITAGKSPDIPLQAGDQIYVNERMF